MNSSPTRSRHYTLSHVYVYFVYSVYFGSCPPIDSISSTQNRYPFQIIIIFCPKFHKNALFLHFLAKKFAKPQMFIVPLHRATKNAQNSSSPFMSRPWDGLRTGSELPHYHLHYGISPEIPPSIYTAPMASVPWNNVPTSPPNVPFWQSVGRTPNAETDKMYRFLPLAKILIHLWQN